MEIDPIPSNNECIFWSQNITTDQMDISSWEYIISGPLLTVLISIGIISNFLIIMTLGKMAGRLIAVNTFLIFLAYWDLILVLSSLLLYNISILINPWVLSKMRYVRAYPFLFVISHTAHTASIWCVVALAIERYFALCYPLKHRTKDNLARCKITLIFISTVSFIISLPKYFEVSIGICRDMENNENIAIVDSSELRRNNLYSLIYIIIGGLLFHSLCPFLIMTTLSAIVIIKVRKSINIRRRMSARPSIGSVKNETSSKWNSSVKNGHTSKRNSSVKSGRTSKRNSSIVGSIRSRFSWNSRRGSSVSSEKNEHSLALSVLVKFLICHCTPTVLDICERLMGMEEFEGPLVDVLVDISNLLVVFNSSINFLLYILCSPKFRTRAILTMKCNGKEENENKRRSFNSSVIKYENGEGRMPY